MNRLFVRATFFAAMVLPSTNVLALPDNAGNAAEVEAHINCAAVFIQAAKMIPDEAGAVWGERAVQVMSLASDLSSVETVQSALRERVPARIAAFSSDVARVGQPAAAQQLLDTLTGCANRYGLLK